MKTSQDKTAFQPVTITIETESEMDSLLLILRNLNRKTDENIEQQHFADELLERIDDY